MTVKELPKTIHRTLFGLQEGKWIPLVEFDIPSMELVKTITTSIMENLTKDDPFMGIGATLFRPQSFDGFSMK